MKRDGEREGGGGDIVGHSGRADRKGAGRTYH